MVELLKQQIKQLLKIPPEPEAPFGAPGSVRIFRAAAGFFRYRMLHWIWRQFTVLLGIGFALWFLSFEPPDSVVQVQEQLDQQAPLEWVGVPLTIASVWRLFEFLAIAGFTVQLPFTFLMVFLDYEYRWYIITDRSLRIREGLIRVDERTMTFSNIQNLSVRQGPLQRVFGISDLEVSSAGGGGSAGKKEHETQSKDLHRAFFRGISNPNEIREAIRAHLKTLRASGLGDPDEDSEPDGIPIHPAAAAPDALGAARTVLDEARALRQALS